jgi:hypothetical protein
MTGILIWNEDYWQEAITRPPRPGQIVSAEESQDGFSPLLLIGIIVGVVLITVIILFKVKPLRKNHKKIIKLSIVILSFLFADGIAMADDFAPPGPSQIDVDDGRKVFFITPPGHESDEQLPTGLYHNTEPPELIYLVISEHGGRRTSYIQEHSVFLSNDGMSFAHIPIPFRFESFRSPITFMPSQGVDAVAIEFYANGVMIKQYTVSQLVERHSDLGHTVTMISWRDYGLIDFDADENTISVTTVDGINHIFDITTGESINNRIISDTSINIPRIVRAIDIPTEMLIGIIVVAVFLVAMIVFIIIICVKRKTGRSK